MNIFNKKNPVKAEVLPDGEYTLEDGSKIVVVGGVVERKPAEEAKKGEVAEPTAEQIVSAVTEVVNEAIAKVKAEVTAEFTAKLDAMAKVTGEHKPAKGVVKTEVKADKTIDAAQKQVAELVAGIRKGIVESRKA